MSNNPNYHVFVLIRTDLNAYKCKKNNNERLEYFRLCLKSVLQQELKDANLHVHVVVLQDKLTASRTPRKTKASWFDNIVNSIYKEENKKDNIEISLYKARCRGAGNAQYLIRDIALKLVNHNEYNNSIFIQLDDYDYFTDNHSVDTIVTKFKDKSDVKVCITGYQIVGDKSKDITNQAGSIHNRLLRGEDKELTYAYADSLGWTKSYRANAVTEYNTMLLSHFDNSQKKLWKYFKKNKNFEDFMDIITLCRKCSEIALHDKATHCYRKHATSITATNGKDKFEQRANALVLTTKMSEQLDSEYKKIVAQFCIIKILLIENILAKLRREEHNIEFNPTDLDKPKHWSGYFWYAILWIWKYCCYYGARLTHIWTRNSSNGDFVKLFVEKLKENNLLEYFADNAKKLKDEGDASIVVFETDEEKIKNACTDEAKKSKVDVSNCFVTKGLMQNAARKRSFRWSLTFNILGILFSIFTFCWLNFEYGIPDTTEVEDLPSVEYYPPQEAHLYLDVEPEVLSVVATIFIAILTFFVNQIIKLYNQRREEKAQIDIYYGEIKDFSRHLLANLKVLKALDDELEQRTEDKRLKVGCIHFTNIKIPHDSILLSNDPMQHALFDDLNDIARFKVNIRNINNSAEYLEKLSKNCTIKELHDAIKWEIVRHIGMIARVKFFEENRNFKMPNMTQLKIYVKVRQINEYIASELTPKDKNKDKEKENKSRNLNYVENYMDLFYKDREKKRDVLIFG